MNSSGSITYHLEASAIEATSLETSAKHSRTTTPQSGRHPKMLRIHRQHSDVLLEVYAVQQDGLTAANAEVLYSIPRETFEEFLKTYLLSPR